MASSLAATKVDPATAIRQGAPQGQSKRRPKAALRRWLGLPLWLTAASSAVERKGGRQVQGMVIAAFAAFLICFSTDFLATMASAQKHPEQWGFTNAAVLVSRNVGRFAQSPKEFLAGLKAQAGVKAILPTAILTDFSLGTSSTQAQGILVGEAFDGPLDSFGFENLRGHHPMALDEISLAVNTARQAGVDVGDRFGLFMYGQLETFVVSGIYRTANNYGQGFRLQVNSLRRFDALFEPNQALVALHDDIDVSTWIRSLQSNAGASLKAQSATDLQMQSFGQIVAGLGGIIAGLAAFFLLILGLGTFNAATLDISANHLAFGMMKSMGMSNHQIRLVLAWDALSKSFVGALVGVLAAWLFAGMLAAPLLDSALGLSNMPSQHNPLNLVLALAGSTLVPGIFAWLAAAKTLTIHPRNLVLE